MWILNTNLKQIFSNLDGIKCDFSTHTVSEETGEINEVIIKELDCPGSTSCVFVTVTFSPDVDYGENEEHRIKN